MYREKDNNCFKSKCNTNKQLQIDCNFMFYIIYLLQFLFKILILLLKLINTFYT